MNRLFWNRRYLADVARAISPDMQADFNQISRAAAKLTYID